MTFVERTAERVARGMNRRKFLRRSAGATFGLVAAWTVEGVGMPSALAKSCENYSSSCRCVPIGAFCNTLNESWCLGASCAGGCTPYPGIYEPSGCWCTKDCCFRNGSGKSICGYYKCCDCRCPGRTGCSCKRFIKTYPPDRRPR